MLRVVLDTDVMVAALQSDQGASRALPVALLRGQAGLVLSTSLMVEYEAVLTRPAVLDRAGLSVGEVIALLDAIAGVCIPTAIDFRWRPTAPDPNDDHVLETAINGSADLIATFNLRDLAQAAASFAIAAVRPFDVLQQIRATSSLD
jgi:putative PIN family toxin of toxin-antitoxin system